MRYISVECEYFSTKFVPNPALLPELFLSKAMSIHSAGVDEQGKDQAFARMHNPLFFKECLAPRPGARCGLPSLFSEGHVCIATGEPGADNDHDQLSCCLSIHRKESSRSLLAK